MATAMAMTTELQKQRAISYSELKKAQVNATSISRSSSSDGSSKKACVCAPTSHAGSFRCRLHRVQQKLMVPSAGVQAACFVPLRLLAGEKSGRRCSPAGSKAQHRSSAGSKAPHREASRLSKVESISQMNTAKVGEPELKAAQAGPAMATESGSVAQQP